jgi:hypothetical protein
VKEYFEILLPESRTPSVSTVLEKARSISLTKDENLVAFIGSTNTKELKEKKNFLINDKDNDIWSFKSYKAKREFEFVLLKETNQAEQNLKKYVRNKDDDTTEEEESKQDIIIISYPEQFHPTSH